jgi:CelD/BcsL family acetyltransferase involved in cellulose biosynthesis
VSRGGVPAELTELRDDWSRLAEASGNVFATWEWAATWWQHLGQRRDPVIGRVRSDSGDTVAIVPLARRRGPVRALRFAGAGVADQVSPLCAPADRDLAAGELRRLVSDTPHDVFMAERLAGDENWPALLDAEPSGRESSPVVAIETDDWEAFLAARSSNFRQQVRKFERRLERDNGLRFHQTTKPEELGRDLDLVFRLHAARWGEGTTDFQRQPARAFHEQFAAVALERGWLRLWIAELDGRPAAAWYGFRFGGADWFYNQGRDPAFERSSVGFVLTAHALREAVRDGMREYKFLLGGEDYKKRFASDDHGLETFVVSKTARGRVGVLAERGSYRLPARSGGFLRKLLA